LLVDHEDELYNTVYDIYIPPNPTAPVRDSPRFWDNLDGSTPWKKIWLPGFQPHFSGRSIGPSHLVSGKWGYKLLINAKIIDNHRLVGVPTPLKNDGVKVSWDDDIPNMMGKS